MASNPFDDPNFGAETQSPKRKPEGFGGQAQAKQRPATKRNKNPFDDPNYGAERSLTDEIKDTAVSTAQGFVRGAEGFSSAVDAGSDASKKLREWDSDLGSMKSGGRRAEQDDNAAEMRKARESGSTWEEVKAYGGAFLDAPVDTTIESLGTAAPQIAVTAATRGRGGQAIAGTMGAGQGAGFTKSSIYEDVKAEHLANGATEEEAEARAQEAQSYTGENVNQIGVGAGLGALASTTGVERAAGRLAGKAPGTRTPGGVLKEAGKGVAKEMPTEMAQGGHEQVAANLAVQNEGFERPTWEGVAGAATLEGMAGGMAGGGTGAAEGFMNTRKRKRLEAEREALRQQQEAEQLEAGAQAEQEGQAGADMTPMDAQAPIEKTGQTGQQPDENRTEIGQPEQAQRPSERLGLNPNEGPLSEAAATAVDTGVSDQMAQQQATQEAESGEEASFIDSETLAAQTGESIDPQTGEIIQSQPATEEVTEEVTGEATGEVDTNTRIAQLNDKLRTLSSQARSSGWDDRLIGERNRTLQELASYSESRDPKSPRKGRGGQDSHLDENGNRINYSDQGAGFTPAVRQLNGRDKPEQMVNVTERTAELVAADMQAEDPDTEFRTVRNRAGGMDIIQRPREVADAESMAEISEDAERQARALDAAANEAATSPTNELTEPTEAQIKAGNYKKGHARVQGMDVTIENPRGSTRKGKRPDGTEWQHEMSDHYGYIKRTEGADAEQVDVYVGSESNASQVYVIDQLDQETGKFDEHKVMMGYPSQAAAVVAYKSNFDPDWKVGPVRPMAVDEFKGWLEKGDNTKPVSEQQQPQQQAEKKDVPVSDGAVYREFDPSEETNNSITRTYTGQIIGKGERELVGGIRRDNGKAEFKLYNKPVIGKGGKSEPTIVTGETVAEAYQKAMAELGQEAPTNAGPQSESPAVQEFIDGKRDNPPSLEEVAAEQEAESVNANAEESTANAEDEIDIQAVTRKQIPDMSDAEIEAAIDHYGPDHKRTKKLKKEQSRRGSDSRPATQDAEKPDSKPTSVKEGVEQARKKKAEEKAGTAPEHQSVGVDDRELDEIVSEFNEYQSGMIEPDGEQVHHLFEKPAKNEIVRLQDKVKVYHKEHGWMTPAEAKARIDEWKANVDKQYDEHRVENSDRVVLSLFDLTGKWSQPWEEAGYEVYRFDIQEEAYTELLGREINVGDVNNFGHEYFADLFGHFEGKDVYAVLAACPCTDFASSGSRHFAAKDKDGRTVASVNLVHQTLATIEYFKPAVWAVENPVGRIEDLGGLPPWRLSFDPNHLGEDYTKKTLIWGRFNSDLPIAPTEPTKGSKMHSQYGGKSMATKNARSATPEGFAYGFFQANNAIDHPVMAIANKYDRLNRSLIEKAVENGITEKQIDEVVDDFYYMDLDDESANLAIRELIDNRTGEKFANALYNVRDLIKEGDSKSLDGAARILLATKKKANETKQGRKERLTDIAELVLEYSAKSPEQIASDKTAPQLRKLGADIGAKVVGSKSSIAASIATRISDISYNFDRKQNVQSERERMQSLVAEKKPIPLKDIADAFGNALLAKGTIYTSSDLPIAKALGYQSVYPKGERGNDEPVFDVAERFEGEPLKTLAEAGVLDTPEFAAFVDASSNVFQPDNAGMALSEKFWPMAVELELPVATSTHFAQRLWFAVTDERAEQEIAELKKQYKQTKAKLKTKPKETSADIDDGGNPIRREILDIADRWENEIGDEGMAKAVRAGAKLSDGATEEKLEFQRSKLNEALAKKQESEPEAGDDDLGAMFDDVLDEVTGANEPETTESNFEQAKDLLRQQREATGNPKAEASIRRKARELADKTPMSDEKTVLALDTIATRLGMGDGNKKDLEFQSQDTPNNKPKTRGAGESLGSAAKNTGKGLSDAINGLGELFGGGGRLNSGLTFDEETYAKAKPLFISAVSHLSEAGKDLRDTMKTVVEMVVERFGAESAKNMKPYVVRFVEDVRDGKVDLNEGEPQAQPENLTDAIYQQVEAITDNRKLKAVVAEYNGIKASEVSDKQMKEAQESLEYALVRKSRDIVEAGRGDSDRAVFDRLLSLYQNQPNLNVRSSGSMKRQAYSTPAPLAYLASRLAGVNEVSTVYEPTAGNGMLVIGAPTDNITANELDAERAENLEGMDIDATQEDALTYLPPDKVDSVIMNPPFGRLRDDDGKAAPIKVDGYTIKSIDHAIAAQALKAMKDDGRATMIIGASKEPGAIGASDRTFFNWLYRHYNVTSHFEVDGDLYNRQGAGWPVRVISINGRKQSNRISPKSGTITRAETWEDVYGQFERNVGAQESDAGRADDTGNTDDTNTENEPADVTDRTGEQTGSDGKRNGRSGGKGGSGTRPGTGSGNRANGRKKGNGRGDSDGGQSELLGEPGADEQPADNQPEGEKRNEKSKSSGVGGETAKGQRGKLSSSEFQSQYKARSKGKNDAVLTPNNMAVPLQEALARLESEVGDLDEYVKDKLGYDTTKELHEAFMGLQVDAVAASIYNIENNKGIIIADQTGVGKGRQAAAIIRYARRNGKTPVFMSVTPNLFSDMYGDLKDIGEHDVKPFIVNASEGIKHQERTVYKSASSKRQKAILQDVANSGQLPDDADTVFLTYSQIQQSQLPRDVLSSLGENSVFVLDESHNVAGNRTTKVPKSKGGGEKLTGAGFMFELINEKPVVYLSATYAKSPDNMPVYYRTDLSQAVDEIDQISEAVAQGGLPLQSVISNMLAQSGQLFRRERSFEGIKIETSIDTDNSKAHEKLADKVAEGLSAINRADRLFHNVAMEGIKDAEEGQGGSATGAGNRAGNVDHVNFSSVIHNYISQLLLGLKAERASEMAIEQHKKGVKPVVALDTTMGSFLQEYVDDMGLKNGDPVEATYSDVLLRALERSRRYSRTLPNGDREPVQVPMSNLDPATKAAYVEAEEIIRSLDIGDIPLSPIDLMRHRMGEAGLNVSEITGRDLTLDYSTFPPTLSKRDSKERTDKRGTVDKFNSGKLDALVLNQSGSTGLSIHASERFKDQKPRHMIVAQAPRDINILMQMLGRINRTGQVATPGYTMMGLDIPAEKRPLAVTAKKMKSLNANTSANDKSDTSVDAPDILNKYGDQVVTEYLQANPELATELDIGVPSNASDDASIPPGIAMQFTGRLARTPVSTQRAAYEEVEAAYAQFMDYLNKTGQNDLEQQTVDLDARILESKIVYEGKDPTTIFGGNTTLHKVDAKYQGKPPTGKDVQKELDKTLKNTTADQYTEKLLNELAEHKGQKKMLEKVGDKYNKASGEIVEKAKEEGYTGEDANEAAKFLEKAYDGEMPKKLKDLIDRRMDNYVEGVSLGKRLERNKEKTISALQDRFKVGNRVMLDLKDEVVTGVVTGVKVNTKGGGDAYAPSRTRVSFMVNSGIRNIELPLSKLEDTVGIFVQKLNQKSDLDEVFKGQDLGGEMRENRYVATGNLIAASADRSLGGRIVSFTDNKGTSHQGLLLPRRFDDDAFESSGEGRHLALRDKDILPKFLRNNAEELRQAGGVFDADQTVRLIPKSDGDWAITVPKANKEAVARRVKFSEELMRAMGSEFYGSGKTMSATFPESRLNGVVKALSELVPLNALPSLRPSWEAAGGRPAAEAVKSFEDGADSTDKPAFRRTGQPRGATPTGMNRATVEPMVQGLMKGWKGRPDVIVRDRVSEFPEGLQKEIRKAGAAGDMRGVLWDGKVYILASNLANREQVEETLLHEAIGHYGLRKMMGREMVPMLTRVYRDLGNSKRANELKQTYFGGRFNPKNLNHRLQIAEELIAHLAESGKQQHQTLFRKIVTAVRAGLRRLGFQLKISQNDLLNLLRGAQQTVENGGIDQPTENDIRFKRAYHGTPHQFDEFSLEAIGNGEGAQAFGWGLYFASRREVAEFYKEALGNVKAKPKTDSAKKELRAATNYADGAMAEVERMVQQGVRLSRLPDELNQMAQDLEDSPTGNLYYAEAYRTMARLMKSGDLTIERTGNIYQVDIPEDSQLLDWEKPLNDQSEGITEAVRAVTDEHHSEGTFDMWMEALGDGGDYRTWRDNLMETVEDRDLSLRLGEKGVPGLRYLDGDSRIASANRDTYNYVIWDDSKVTVEAVNDEIRQAEAMFKRAPSSIPRGQTTAALGQKMTRRLKGRLTDLKPAGLGALPLMYLRDFAPKGMTALDRYLDEKRAMDADRNEMHTRYDQLAQRWLKERMSEGVVKDKAKTVLGMRNKDAAPLDKLMHDSTIAGVDPSKPRPKGADRAMYQALRKRFDALPDTQKQLFRDVRDAYGDQVKAMEKAISENIKKSSEFAKRRAARDYQAEVRKAQDELTGEAQKEAIEEARERYRKKAASADAGKSSRLMLLRQKFEQMRVDEPYFPLKRFGDYFVALREKDGTLRSFSMFEKAADMEEAATELAKEYPNLEVTTGRQSNKEDIQGAIDPGFVADIQELVSENVDDESLNDAIYQMYLETLPDFSMRKSFIHRKKVPGYDEDAMRVFASTMFHSSHQIARLKHNLEMDEMVEMVEEQASESDDSVDAMTIANELRRRHEWVMNPKGGKIAQHVTSFAFAYQLGVTPAAAFVNTTQTFMLGIPILGTRFKSESGATKELLKASGEFVKGKGHVEKNLTGEEKAAFDEFMRLGLIDKTQAHDLAGVGETGVEYSAVRHKVMGAISFMFHHAERYNREVTSLAAYRLARNSGMNHKEAVKEAAELTWKVHFDYSSGNRARYMQGDTAKILLVFRQHSINMLSRLAIDTRQMLKGESKEVRREAMRRMAGIYGMFALMAGMMGVPGAQALLMVLDWIDDDDDPWTAEDKIKRYVYEALGEDAAEIFFRGAPGKLANASLTERIGMGHLWFFSPYRELEGRDAYYYWMEQVLGAAPAVLANIASGLGIMGEGHTWRGFETMMPKAVKDVMRGIRYGNEGVQSLNGYSMVDEADWQEIIAQSMGFMPASIAEKYDRNSALKNAEQRVKGERRNLLNRFALATRTNDTEMRERLRQKIREFNKRNPRLPITAETIMKSMQGRNVRRNKAQDGVLIDDNLNYLRNELPGS